MTAPEQELKELPILAVDDEGSNLLLLERVLEREGYSRVTATTDPTTALELLDELEPALVLLDLHMPVVDGFEVMERLGGDGGAGVPILVLTADATDDTKGRALRAGARDFLTKPIDVGRLLEIVNGDVALQTAG
jgi:CheY-like chemotaxis protein